MKRKHRLRRISLCLLALLLLGTAAVFGVNTHVKNSVRERILSAEDAAGLEADCILVLGCGVVGNDPSLMLRDRLDESLRLYALGASEKLLMSGDHGQTGYDEVNVMKRYAIEAGVSSEAVFMDHAGFSTYESLYRARDIFEAERVIIVTQEYHLYRALYIAERLGLEAYGVASAGDGYPGQGQRDTRELLARCKDFLYVLFRPEPTYLGDAIPVAGNGDATNDDYTIALTSLSRPPYNET